MARRDGELVAGITAFADGPDEMREVIRHHVGIGVDNVKLSMSGEEVSQCRAAYCGRIRANQDFEDHRDSFSTRLLLYR